jgi:hypothetical protein
VYPFTVVGAVIVAPQFGQKFARSGTTAWQVGQFICIA